MRVNVYAEEMTDRVEIISKEIDGHQFTGLRIYLELPATVNGEQHQGPFLHRPGDDDSSAVTFWGKKDLREVLRKALAKLNEHYYSRDMNQMVSNAIRNGCSPSQMVEALSGTHDFGWALAHLREGRRVQRAGWNGKGMFLFRVENWKALPADMGGGYMRAADGAAVYPHLPFIAMKTTHAEVVPWLASQTDMLATDWALWEL